MDVCELMSPTRSRRVVDLRHLLMYVGRKEFDMLTTEVGQFFDRDHVRGACGEEDERDGRREFIWPVAWRLPPRRGAGFY